GAVPNTGDQASANGPLEIGSGSAGAGGTKESTEKSEIAILASRKKISTRTGPGEATVISASVRVPHSYFVRALRLKNHLPVDKDPDDAALTAFIVTE